MSFILERAKKFLLRFYSEERAQGILEYALLASFVGVLAWTIYYFFFTPGGNILEIYNQQITHYVSLPIP